MYNNQKTVLLQTFAISIAAVSAEIILYLKGFV